MTGTGLALPANPDAEWSVVAQMMTRPDAIPEVIGLQVSELDFFNPDTRVIYETAVESYYADERVDAVTLGDKLAPILSRQWSCDPGEVTQRLWQQAQARGQGESVLDHAELIRRHGDNRRLLGLMEQARAAIGDNQMSPSEIADMLSANATQIAVGTEKRGQIMSFMEVGAEYLKHLRRLKLAREQGIELSAYFGLKFVDSWIKGLAPTELMLVGGEPGVGKSALTWEMATGFAKRQLKKPEQMRMGTLVLSLEMALVGSTQRVAQSLARVDGDRLREGEVNDDELTKIIRAWKSNKSLPIYFNFASNFKMSQLRALIVEAIRRYKVGLVIIDHFRMFDPDRRINNANQEDEAKARFLKEDIAKDLNVAVVCLAHTVKLKRELSDGRPQLGDLRGSGQVAAHADVVGFMYRPVMYATEQEILEGVHKETDAEMIFRKNRNGALGATPFHFEPQHMLIRDGWA